MCAKDVKGFTLVELIIVIVIIGILATLALPKLSGQIESIRSAEALNMFGAIRRAAVNCIDMMNESGKEAGAIAARSKCDQWAELGVSVGAGSLFSYYSDASTVAKTIQFRALRNGNAICLDLDVTNGLAQYSLSPNTIENPYYSIVNRAGSTLSTLECKAAGAM